LSLSRDRNALFEAFRDQLIEVQNMGFPVRPPSRIDGPADGAEQDERVLELARMIDKRFSRYYQQEALGLLVAGERGVRSAFSSVTLHQDAVVGTVDGDYSASSPHDLGKIAWATIKEVMAGTARRALSDLDALTGEPGVTSGLDAVIRCVSVAEDATLLVEDDYHVHGHLDGMGDQPKVVASVDVRDAMDDVVDVVVEKILADGGSVVFVDDGALERHGRIVLITNETEGAR
jgi:hypothetical protein